MDPLHRLKEASAAFRQAVEDLDTFHQSFEDQDLFWGETNQALHLKLREAVDETKRAYDDAATALLATGREEAPPLAP